MSVAVQLPKNGLRAQIGKLGFVARSPFFGSSIGKWVFVECAARTYERSE